jgi:hypothetical protein
MQRRRIEAFEDEKFKCKGKRYSLYGQVRPFPWEGDASGSGKRKLNGQVWTKPSLKKFTLSELIAFLTRIMHLHCTVNKNKTLVIVKSVVVG